MQKLLTITVALIVGLTLGISLRPGSPSAIGDAAVAPNGGGGGACAATNGDVNADGNIDLSDAVSILGYLFLGNPPALLPACSGPPVAEVRRDSPLGVLLVLLDLVEGLKEISVPPSCGGTPSVCCTGGNPQADCGPLKFELVDLPLVSTGSDPSRFPFTLRLRIRTTNDLPVNVFGADCGLMIDTTLGNPIVELRGEMVFQTPTADDPRPVTFGPLVLDGLEAADMTLGGGFACTQLNLGLGWVANLLSSVVEDHFRDLSQKGVCQPWLGCQRP
jgi:hypothetical protein